MWHFSTKVPFGQAEVIWCNPVADRLYPDSHTQFRRNHHCEKQYTHTEHFIRTTCTPTHSCSSLISQSCGRSATHKIIQLRTNSFRKCSHQPSEYGKHRSQWNLWQDCGYFMIHNVLGFSHSLECNKEKRKFKADLQTVIHRWGEMTMEIS